MIELFWALIGSKWVRRLGILFIAVAAYSFWESRVENRGAERVTTRIEKKANDNAATATDVRDGVASGKGGKPDPYARRP